MVDTAFDERMSTFVDSGKKTYEKMSYMPVVEQPRVRRYLPNGIALGDLGPRPLV